MPCGWFPGDPTHESIERDMRESALHEAHELLNWITSLNPNLLEYVPPDLDYVGKLCVIVENLGEERFNAFMIDNLDDPQASRCLYWWSKHKVADKKRKRDEKKKIEKTAKDNKLGEINNVFKNMSSQQLDRVLDVLKKL